MTRRHANGAQLLWRGLLLECPSCGHRTLARGPLRVHERCRVCGLVFEHDDAFYLGASVVNYTVTALIALVPALVGIARGTWSVPFALLYAAAACLVFPVIFYWHSKSLWMALYYWFVPDDLNDTASPLIDAGMAHSHEGEDTEQQRIEEALAALEGGRRRRHDASPIRRR